MSSDKFQPPNYDYLPNLSLSQLESRRMVKNPSGDAEVTIILERLDVASSETLAEIMKLIRERLVGREAVILMTNRLFTTEFDVAGNVAEQQKILGTFTTALCQIFSPYGVLDAKWNIEGLHDDIGRDKSIGEGKLLSYFRGND